MFHELYQNLPLNIDPIAFAIGSFSIKWYSLSYLAGFLVVYLILRWRVKNQDSLYDLNLKQTDLSLIQDFLIFSFFAAIVGGRIGYVFLYNFYYYKDHLLEIVWPFGENGHFMGIYGMSYFGALFAVILMSVIFCRKNKLNFFAWADFVVVAVPAGYFFGRIGNFFNGELIGRITNSSFGMYFQSDPMQLRHPSQLYEAILEGFLLFLILWILRNRKRFIGQLSSIYLMGYGIARFIAELFRAPDFGVAPVFLESTGKIFSIILVFFGIILYLKLQKAER